MAQVSFRMDDDLKVSAEETFRSMGMTLSTAINVFVTQAVRSGEFPFVIKADPFYSAANMNVLRRRAKEMEAGASVSEHDIIADGDIADA